MGRDVAEHVDVPGLGIDLEVDGMTAVGEVGEDPAPPGRLAAPRVPAGSAEDRKPMPRNLALGRGADQLAKRDIPPAGTNAALRKLHVVRLRLEQVGRA